MVWTAVDSTGQPDPNAVKGAGYSFVAGYVGTQFQRYGTTRGYIDRCLSVGIGFWPIFEEWGSQFLGGYDTARQMMGRMRAGWDQLGLPNDGSCCPAIALVDPNPGMVSGNEAALIAFAKGVDDSCWLPSWTGYGSRYGLDLVRGEVHKMARYWGVGTWGFGERGDGSLPANVGADMIQHGNKHAAIAGCDENTVFTENMGQLGGGGTDLNDDQNKWLQALYQWFGGDARLGDIDGAYETLAGDKTVQGYISNKALLDRINELAGQASGGGSGLTEAQVRAVVRDELDKTKLGH